MKLLVVGGTKFLGRHLVEIALREGAEVTLFNRGKSNPNLFPNVRTINGNRDTDIQKLDSEGPWDAVVDCCAYFPASIKKSVATLKDKTNKYTFLSSVSVYSDFSSSEINENSSTANPENPSDLENDEGRTYGIRKKACEDVVVEAFGVKSLIIRPGLIVGPHDQTWRFPYWVERIKRGGQILAPGKPNDPVQFVDARDLAEWIYKVSQSDVNGVFNTVGPATLIDWKFFLESCSETLSSASKLHWVNEQFLLKNEIQPWVELPLWVPVEVFGIHRVNDRKARNLGFKSRPIADTIIDTWDWIENEKLKSDGKFGLSPVKESQLLTAYLASEKLNENESF